MPQAWSTGYGEAIVKPPPSAPGPSAPFGSGLANFIKGIGDQVKEVSTAVSGFIREGAEARERTMGPVLRSVSEAALAVQGIAGVAAAVDSRNKFGTHDVYRGAERVRAGSEAEIRHNERITARAKDLERDVKSGKLSRTGKDKIEREQRKDREAKQVAAVDQLRTRAERREAELLKMYELDQITEPELLAKLKEAWAQYNSAVISEQRVKPRSAPPKRSQSKKRPSRRGGNFKERKRPKRRS